MSKPNDIRKKALEYAKRRMWDKALEEYVRLAEVDAQNPNVYNELGDLYLQTGNKVEAFKAFHSAVDAYGRMALFNNAVAVCKKIIRLNSVDRAVYGKLARLRNKQGLKKEAADYAVSFIEKMEKDASADPEDVKTQVTEIAREFGDAPEVLERAARHLVAQHHTAEAAKTLEQLVTAYQSLGMSKEAEQTRQRMVAIGHAATPPTGATVSTAAPAAAVPGIESHRVDTQATRPAPSASPVATNRWAGGSPYDVGAVDLSGESAAVEEVATATEIEEMEPTETQPEPKPARPAPEPLTAPKSVRERAPAPQPEPIRAAPAAPAPATDAPLPRSGDGVRSDVPPPGPSRPLTDTEVWIPADDLPEGIASSEDGSGRIVQVSELVNHFHAEVKSDVEAEDYRSHYDLGMAYLEMDLITEAIREFQFAANSSMYQVRSLELIGLCFIKQNQARLAVKQLEKGLALVGDAERDAIGLYYNLGLAYELTGDHEKAKRCFEEVYVIDVGFRDVASKMAEYSS